MLFIDQSVTRNLRVSQGWQVLTVLVILAMSVLPLSKASPLSKITVDASNDPVTLWQASDALRNVEYKENENENRMRQDLPASPAELLKPDKFLFYTYNDQGNMITKQMSLHEIQTLIAGGNGGHVAMDIYEPQKSGDALNGEKKVMDVVEKVQNVLKSALDKPSTIAASLSTIPEYANAEWSSILPAILTNGEVEANPTSEKPTYVAIIKPDSSTSIQEESVTSSTEVTKSSMLKSSTIAETTEQFNNETVSTSSSVVLTSVQAESNSSMTPSDNEMKLPDIYTEKPMIPVAVITTEGQPFSDHSEVIENLVHQTSTKSTIEFNDINHLATNKTRNATIFEEVPVKVWDESERNVTSHEPSTERVTEYVPISTMTPASTVNNLSAPATVELVSSTESETTKLVTEMVSQETSTMRTSVKINQPEKITTVQTLSEGLITDMVTPVIEMHVQTESSENLFKDNITTLTFNKRNTTVADILEVTTPCVASIIPTSLLTSTLVQTEITKNEQPEKSQSPNLEHMTQAISFSTSASILPDDDLTTLSSASSSDDTQKHTTTSMVTKYLLETTEATIITTMKINSTLNNLQPNLKPIDDFTSTFNINKNAANIENTTSMLEVSEIKSPVVKESTSSKIETEISKINDTSSIQPVEVNDKTDSTLTSAYIPETTFVRINSSTVDTSSLSNTISDSAMTTKAVPVFNTNDLISSVITKLNDHTLNTTTESVNNKITNYTLEEETLRETTTTLPFLAENRTNLSTNHIDEFIEKTVSSPSASQDTMTTTPVVSDELVTATDLIKSGNAGTTTAEVQNVTMSSQVKTSLIPAINHKGNTNIKIINNMQTVTSKEPSFIRHQIDANEMLNATATLLSLEQENRTDMIITESHTNLSSLTTEHTTVEKYATTLMLKEEFVTEASLKEYDVLKNRTNIKLETSLKANESRYSDFKEETSTQMFSTPYVKLNVTFTNDLLSTNAPNISDDNTIALKMELPMESVYSSTTEKLLGELPIQMNTMNEEPTEKIATVSESNQIEPVTANGSINIKSNKTNGTSLEMVKDKTKIQIASNDSISVPSRIIEETSSLQSLTSSTPMVAESSIHWQLSSKSTYNKQETESYLVGTQTTEKWMLIPHKIITPTTERTTVSITTQKMSQNITEKIQSSTLDVRLPSVPSEIKQSERIPLDSPQSVNALDVSVTKTENDVVNFSKMCNNLAFEFWLAANKGLSTSRSLVLSPFGMTSLLAMVFLGARGSTSDQMNELLKLDDVATFNPHLVFQNITDMVGLTRDQGITNAAFVRELFVDRAKVRKTLPFYKEQAQQFYEGLVAEVNFATIGDIVRRRTNLLIRKQTGGRIKDFIKANTVPLRSPLAAVSANVFQTNCNSSFVSSDGRDGELYFAVSPAIRQRKLIPVPAMVWRSNILAGYEPSLDATAVALGKVESLVTTVFVLPGQQGHVEPGDSLDRLERRLIASASRDNNWNRLLKILLPRNSLELQIPKFTHRSVVNATAALKRMGFERLFTEQADLKGINGIGNHLHLSDILQINLFGTCGDESPTNGRHHMETYPATPIRRARQRDQTSVDLNSAMPHAHREPNLHDYLETNASKFEETILMNSRTDKRRKRHVEDTKVMRSERPRLKLDRPFLYFVRHNPTGLILHMGRFNPRLLP